MPPRELALTGDGYNMTKLEIKARLPRFVTRKTICVLNVKKNQL
jgi:hypothetical protein